MTKLLYLEDFDIGTCDAVVEAVAGTEDGRHDVRLDQTCFYPRGGGQDWDEGIIRSDGATFRVQEVRLDESGDVHHIGTFEQGNVEPGDIVACEVDSARRAVNTRLHSAGHVIDMAVDRLGFGWIATKGQHYPHLSAVEYSGEWDAEQAETIRANIERVANELTATDIENSIRFIPVSEMHTVCRHVPENIPTNKPARVVMYGDFGVPCGGTHVRELRTIGKIRVPKVKAKKGVIRVNYAVEGIGEDE